MTSSTGSDDRGSRGLAQRIESKTEVPRLLLALAYIPAFVARYWPGVSPEVYSIASLAANLILAAFAVEFGTRLAVADKRLTYLRTHWVDALVVLVPFLRVLGVLPAVRLLPFLLEAAAALREIMGRYRGAYVLLVGLVSVLSSAAVVMAFERRAGGSIRTLGDALWWATATITTVGYGDLSPETAGGRVVAVFLMFIGIALFGVLTAGVAAYFVEGTREGEETTTIKDLMAKLEEVDSRLEEQSRALESLLRGRGEGELISPAPSAFEPRKRPQRRALQDHEPDKHPHREPE